MASLRRLRGMLENARGTRVPEAMKRVLSSALAMVLHKSLSGPDLAEA
jgi:hypothetical protein